MLAADWAAEARAIAARWEHGHDGLTPDCALCHGEYAEVQELTAQHRAADHTPPSINFLEQHVKKTDPAHPITIETVSEERTVSWECPPQCPTPHACGAVRDLRHEAHQITDRVPDGNYLYTSDFWGTLLTHLDRTAVLLPVVTKAATVHTVSLLATSDVNYRFYVLTVQRRGDRWAVQWGEDHCLGADGTWAEGVSAYGRGDDWLNAHRFDDLDTALALAEKAAPDVTFNGITALQAWTLSDNQRRLAEALGTDKVPLEGPVHVKTALDILTALAPQMDPRAAATWMTTARYPSTTGDRTALQEIAAGNGHLILDQARTTAAPQNGAQ